MSALDAVATVLRDVGGPLHYREITERILTRKLWTTAGKAPQATVNARLAVDIKRRGAASRFVRTGPGLFALNPNVSGKPRPVERLHPPARSREGHSAKRLSFTDAAERVLRQSGKHEPLHYGTITERALALRLIRTEGRTPAATMYSVILSEIRRQEVRGESPRFVQHGRGMVGLSAWLPTEAAQLIEEQNREVRQSLLDRARSASPSAFENRVGELLAAMGFEEVEVTSASKDGGVDVRSTLVVGEAVRIRMAVQAKRWKHNVRAPTVQQLRGSLGAHEQGLIITTSDFSSGAKTEAARADAAPVALMNGEQLAALLAKHQIGAHTERYELFTLDEVEAGDA